MNIVKQLEESGILDAMEAGLRVESNQIVRGENRNGDVVCFTSSSTPNYRIAAKNSESFKRDFFEIKNVQPLVNFPVRFVKRDFERSRNVGSAICSERRRNLRQAGRIGVFIERRRGTERSDEIGFG